MLTILFLAKTTPTQGNFTIYDGGFLRAPPGFPIENESTQTDDQKKASSSVVAGHMEKGHFLTLIVGKGLNSKESSKYFVSAVGLHNNIENY